MSQKQEDLRVRKTRTLLQKALIELSEEKGFKRISVGAIAERAMVNRVTFYRHYTDKYQLARKIFEDAIDDLDKGMGPAGRPRPQPDFNSPPEPLVRFFSHIAANARLYRAMMGIDGDPWFTSRVREYLTGMLAERFRIRSQRQETGKSPIPQKVAVELFAAATVGIIGWWLQDESNYPASQVATWIRHLAVKGWLEVVSIDPASSPKVDTSAPVRTLRKSDARAHTH